MDGQTTAPAGRQIRSELVMNTEIIEARILPVGAKTGYSGMMTSLQSWQK